MKNVRLVTDGLGFPEGPVALSDGSVVVVEIKTGNLTRVAPDGTKDVVARCGGGPNGAAVGPDGKFYICNNGGFEWTEVMGMNIPGHQPHDYIGGRIQRVDITTGEVEDLYTECDGNPLRGPNDIVFDSDGGFWFTESELRALPQEYWDVLTTNICWGGDDMRTAYITVSGTGRLVACEWETPGLQLAFNA